MGYKMADPETSIHDSDLYKNVFCNPAFEPDGEHDEMKEIYKVIIYSEPVKAAAPRDDRKFGLCVACVRGQWRTLGVVVGSAVALLLLAVLGLTLAFVLTYMNRNPSEEVLSLNSWSGDNISQSLVPKPTTLSAEYNILPECGGELTDSEGTIHFPNHPGPYPPYSMCKWMIKVPPPHVVQIRISFLAIEGPSPCHFDWLETREEAEHFTIVKRFCGKVAPPTVNTNTSTLWMSFYSDGSIESNGFIAQYYAILPWQISCYGEEFMCDNGHCLLAVFVCDSQPNCEDYTDEANCSHTHKECGGQRTGPQGSLSSPNHPRPYSNQQHCTWRISAEKGQIIRLNFHNFSLETQDVCQFDFVEVQDSATAGYNVLGRYCGSDLPPTLTSSGPVMTVVFVADDGVADSGFYASYQVISLSERSCSSEEFACITGECLHRAWVCDGWNDCADGADEQDCSNSTYPPINSACEPIQLEMCQDLSYNLTSFPNTWLSIADQREAAHMLRQYKVLMDLDCFGPLQKFVCALFMPQCTVHGGVLQPCRSVCSKAEQQCFHSLELFSLSWPFSCHLLPKSNNTMLCSLP